MLIDLSCPVEIRGTSIYTNPETGSPYLSLKLLNISEKTITSLKLDVKMFDESNAEITSVPVELPELSVLPKEAFTEDCAVPLSDFPNAKHFDVEVTYATFENEEPYTPSEENTVDFDNSETSIEDALLLRKLVSDAVCYSKECDDHWKCACGRPNFLDSEKCVRCGRNKDIMLQNFSSKDALENALKAHEHEEELRALEAEKILKEKKKNRKKAFINTGIIILSLIVLAVAGYFVRYAIINFQGDSALKSGDYFKAHELYSKINSKKVANVVDKVMGNTPANLVYSTGYFAEDDENLYYITYNSSMQPCNLIKESKSTKDKTILTDAAYCDLNVVGDYIYFINTDGYPCRMTKDGKTTDILLETQTNYICVVNDSMYYLKADYDNPKGFTEEECEILASQGQIDTFIRLHKLNLDTKEDTLVSTENITTCSIFGDRIYYLTSNDVEDTWAMSNLKSMNMNGKDIKTIIDTPVTSFFLRGDSLYYVSYFDESRKGSDVSDVSSLGCTIIKHNLKTNAKSTITSKEDGLVMDMNVSGDTLIYIAYNREEFMNYYLSADENATIPSCSVKTYNMNNKTTNSILSADVSSLNVHGDNIFCLVSGIGTARLSLDGTSFEPVYEDGTNPLSSTTEIIE